MPRHSLPFDCSVVPGDSYWFLFLALQTATFAIDYEYGLPNWRSPRSSALAFASCNFSREVSRNMGTDALNDMLHLTIRFWREVKRARDQALPGATGPAMPLCSRLDEHGLPQLVVKAFKTDHTAHSPLSICSPDTLVQKPQYSTGLSNTSA